MFFLTSPRNPFGDVFSVSLLRQVAKRIKGTFVVDETFVDFADSSALELALEDHRFVLVRSFSKGFGLADLRVGYIISPALADVVRDGIELPSSVGAFAQLTAAIAIRERRLLDECWSSIRTLRSRFIDRLSGIAGLEVWPSQANFVCVSHPSAFAVAYNLSQAGIQVQRLRLLPGFPPSWDDGIRIAVPDEPIQDEILARLQRICR